MKRDVARVTRVLSLSLWDIVNLDVTIFVLVNLDVPSNLDVANNSVLNLDVANNSVVKFRRTQQFSVKFRRSQSTNRCNSVYRSSDICCMRNAHRAPGIAIRLIRSVESLAFSCCREITSCRLATSRLRRSVGSASCAGADHQTHGGGCCGQLWAPKFLENPKYV